MADSASNNFFILILNWTGNKSRKGLRSASFQSFSNCAIIKKLVCLENENVSTCRANFYYLQFWNWVKKSNSSVLLKTVLQTILFLISFLIWRKQSWLPRTVVTNHFFEPFSRDSQLHHYFLWFFKRQKTFLWQQQWKEINNNCLLCSFFCY